MADDKFIMIGLNDERSKDIADVLGNKTCKKIIDFLSEKKEASEKDISDALSMPINTVEYNLNKLIKAGLIEKSKNFFWSVKGKKIVNYKLSNKKIIISPKSIVKGIVPALIGVFLGAFGIKILSDRINYNNVNLIDAGSRAIGNSPAVLEKVGSAGAENVGAVGVDYVKNVCVSTEIWLWFLLGGLFVILIFLLWNHFKKMKGGF